MKPSRTPTPKSRYSTFRGPEFEFAFPKDKAYKKFIRNLKTIDPTYWGVLDADGEAHSGVNPKSVRRARIETNLVPSARRLRHFRYS